MTSEKGTVYFFMTIPAFGKLGLQNKLPQRTAPWFELHVSTEDCIQGSQVRTHIQYSTPASHSSLGTFPSSCALMARSIFLIKYTQFQNCTDFIIRSHIKSVFKKLQVEIEKTLQTKKAQKTRRVGARSRNKGASRGG